MRNKKSINKLSDLGVLARNVQEAANISVSRAEASHQDAVSPQDGLPLIRLQRSIKIDCWRVLGQISKSAKRKELMPILLRARERGVTDSKDIATHLLFEPRSRSVVAQRLLQIAKLYGLVEEKDCQYTLTESGHLAIAMDQVFVPENGTWTIWVSRDPLLASRILHVEPWTEPTAYDEVRGKARDSAQRRKFERVPQWIRDTVGVVSPSLTGGATLRIDSLEDKGEVVESEAKLAAKWDVSESRLRVVGSMCDRSVDTVIDAPSVDTETVWMQLLQSEEIWPQWDSTALALRVAFEKTEPGERESLVRSITFSHPKITPLGEFDATTVVGVALQAQTQADANRWAEWRLSGRVRDYVTAERFREWTTEAAAPFSSFHLSTPTRKALADDVWQANTDRPTPKAWHLAAAEDWGL